MSAAITVKRPSRLILAFVKKIIGDEPQITSRPADALKPEMDALREKVKDVAKSDEDVLSYALFDQVALKFFESRKLKELVNSPAKYYVNIHEIK